MLNRLQYDLKCSFKKIGAVRSTHDLNCTHQCDCVCVCVQREEVQAGVPADCPAGGAAEGGRSETAVPRLESQAGGRGS